jgi:hypothetical protein
LQPSNQELFSSAPRQHIDQALFKYAFMDIKTSAGLILRFDELLAETTEAISVTKPGL